MKPMSFPLIYSNYAGDKGRGVFAGVQINKNTLIETCPVIVISSGAEINLVACTSLLNYAFRWNNETEAIIVPLGFGSLYNHSSNHNARYIMNIENETLDIIALKPIESNEEITINYMAHSDKDATSWFNDRGIEYVE